MVVRVELKIGEVGPHAQQDITKNHKIGAYYIKVYIHININGKGKRLVKLETFTIIRNLN